MLGCSSRARIWRSRRKRRSDSPRRRPAANELDRDLLFELAVGAAAR